MNVGIGNSRVSFIISEKIQMVFVTARGSSDVGDGSGVIGHGHPWQTVRSATTTRIELISDLRRTHRQGVQRKLHLAKKERSVPSRDLADYTIDTPP